MSVTVRVPAKVNLHLGVGVRRADGFHDLVTVYQALSLTDEVTVERADELSVVVHGEGARLVPADATNLAARAALALARRAGVPPAVRVVIRKGIPVAAGMAGGSADAAGALVACDALWGTELSRAELASVAATLGSDVPFALYGATALGTGRGERVTPVLTRGTYHWVLALATEGLSTAVVYERLDRLRGEPAPAPSAPAPPRPLLAALRAGDPVALGRALANDLQPAAVSLRPRLRAVLRVAEDLGALGAVVSGSGPTVALLARSEAHAVGVTAALAGAGVCDSVRRVHAPVPGAQVVVPARA
ncbi:MAG TPA: 4-(cytidine 5'-diphospho)-2-C-methyl-D-erythritol kinase [Mycobacteriales bacterium]|nr:4-(cytidine 5'-diphospho)-2-C-methyl-D-erythritol kinase [Mycobacteriales bacterium]